MITIVNTCEHGGIKYECTSPRVIVRDIKGRIMGSILDKEGQGGVWITYPDGVRIWRPNDFYGHIEPIPYYDCSTACNWPVCGLPGCVGP